ncbi:MAG: phosphatidate cytidylyltransferase [Planctomycetales bacterium]|nr:phosphatidate cytidylyltransferase [Planctomycetales bacterium]
MLIHRLAMAAAILAPLLGLLWADITIGPAGAWLAPLFLLVVVAAVDEVLGMLRTGGHQVVAWSAHAGALMIALATLAPLAWSIRGLPYPPHCPLGQLGWPWAAMGLAVGLAFFAEMLRYRDAHGVVVRVSLVVMTVAYAGLLSSFLVALRLFHDNAWGMAALVSMVFVVKFSDTGAYTFGRLLGKRKLAPILSPKKTVEGAIGGLATGCAAAVVFFVWIAPRIVGTSGPVGPWWGWLLFGVLVTLAGMVGDLAASILKRDMGCKDSSRWMPGLGGVLDVIDSLLVGGPVAYLCWAAFLGPEA